MINLMLMFTYMALVLVGLVAYKLYWQYRREEPFNKEVLTFFQISVVAYATCGLVALYFGDVGLAKSYLAGACYFAFLAYA